MVHVLVHGGQYFAAPFLALQRLDSAKLLCRAAVFFLLATSGLAPIFHVAWAEGSSGLIRIPLGSLTVTCSSYAIGTAVYVTRFPEKFWPARFDLIVS
jgi:adiponectin receptor